MIIGRIEEFGRSSWTHLDKDLNLLEQGKVQSSIHNMGGAIH